MGPDTHLGLREEELPEACGRVRASGGRLRLTGLHFHRGSQVLDPAAIADHFGTALELAAAVHREHHPIGKVNFGGGWGVDYWDGQAPLDLVDLAGRLAPIFDGPAARALPADCRWIVEPGRFLVAEAGIFAVSIRHAKQGYERHFAVADGGIHHCHMLSGGLGQVLRRDFRHEIWPAQPPAPGAAPCDASLAGPLCLPHDLLLQRAAWPGGPPRAGDRVVFFNCGAYGLTASPSQFLGHPPPRELLL
jgi:diaminopimelate decarboxylase